MFKCRGFDLRIKSACGLTTENIPYHRSITAVDMIKRQSKTSPRCQLPVHFNNDSTSCFMTCLSGGERGNVR